MTRWRVLVALVLAGCLEASSRECPDGTICPVDLICAPVSGCASPEQLEACNTVDEEGDCSVDGIPGSCLGGVCVFFVCGDGEVGGNEQCDPGSDATTTCRERGFYQGGEVSCGGDCSWDTSFCSEFCGDGLLQAPQELCEIDIEPEGTCTSYGFDAGGIECAGCAVGFAGCRVIGWTDARISAGIGLSVRDLAAAGDSLVAVGSSEDDGTPFAARWRGTWTLLGDLEDALRPTSVSAIGTDDVWMTGARGDDGFVARWDGAGWLVDDLPSPGIAIFARADDEVYVLSDSGVRSWDGVSWTYSQLADGFVPSSVWAEPDGGPVYVAGLPHGLFRLDGGGWEPMESPPGDGAIDIIGTPNGTLWAASMYGGVHRWDGDQWIDTELPRLINDAVFAVDSEGELFVLAGWQGMTEQQRYTVYHYQGSWRLIGQQIESDLLTIDQRAFGGFGHQMFAFGNTRGFRYGGAAWWNLTPVTVGSAMDVWASQAEIFMVAGNGDVHHLDASGWTLTGIAGERVDGAGSDVYVLDRDLGEISHWDGEGWTTSTLGATNPTEIAVRGRNDVYVLTNFGTRVQHWNGSDLTPVALVGLNLQQIDCADDGPCAAGGLTGTFWSSESIPSPTERSMYAIWVGPGGRILAGGDFGELWLHDGTGWRAMENTLTAVVNSVVGTSAGDAFATAGLGLIHYGGGDDLAWYPVRLDDNTAIAAMSADGATPVMGGALPTVVRLERTYRW